MDEALCLMEYKKHTHRNQGMLQCHAEYEPMPASFELSTNYKGKNVVMYSKRLSKKWPRINLLVENMKNAIDDMAADMPLEEFVQKYTHKV